MDIEPAKSRPFWHALVRIAINAVAVLAGAYVLPGVRVDGFLTALVTGVVLGVLNALVKPVLTILSLPLIFVTFGLFYLVVTGATVMLASWLVPGFDVSGLGWAILFAIVVAIVNLVLGD